MLAKKILHSQGARLVGAVALASICVAAQTPQAVSLFTDADRTRILAYWADPSRYSVAPPAEFRQKGLWQVRLTTEGSIWLWNYNKTRKVSAPPTADAQPANDQQKVWEQWLVAKLAHDRWQAWQVARQANQQAIGVDAPLPDKSIPPAEPPLPGPMPTDMLAAAGDPPDFAQAVVPMQHTITFDDGTLTYVDHVLLGNPRYAYYRFAEGVKSEGQQVSTVDAARFSRLCQLAQCNDSESRVMRAVSPLEGGFDSINTYDTGFVSVGFIQFASLREGAGSLGSMLLHYKQDDPNDFADDFHKYGIEVTPTGSLDILDPQSGAEVVGAEANKRIIADKRLIAVFQHAGLKSDPFCAAQIKSAKQQFYPAEDPISVSTPSGTLLTGKVSDFIRSEAGMATLFDRKINTGTIAALSAKASQIAALHPISALSDLAPYERDIVAALKYRGDFLSDPTLSQPNVTPGLSHRKAKRQKAVAR